MKKTLLTMLTAVSLAVFATTSLNVGTANAVTLHTWQQYTSGGLYLRANSSKQVYTYKGNDSATKWEYIAVGTTGIRLMKNYYTKQCLDSNTSGYVYTNACSTSNVYQQWKTINISGTDYYLLKNVKTGLCVTTQNTAAASTAMAETCGLTKQWQYWY